MKAPFNYDQKWENFKESLWKEFRIRGYQGEEFIYEQEFNAALDKAKLFLENKE